jgi:hypothetical protein
MKGRSQDVMPVGNELPGLLEQPNVQILIRGAINLLEVHADVASGQVVEQHAL